jgi:HEAT repeat protein
MENAAGDFDLKKMIGDYMENGLLENITDMFKHDTGLYRYAGDLLKDERMRVRIGTTAMLETLAVEDPENVRKAVPSLLPLLDEKEALTRGDAAYALGIIGDETVRSRLEDMKNDEDPDVRSIAGEAIDEISRRIS